MELCYSKPRCNDETAKGDTIEQLIENLSVSPSRKKELLEHARLRPGLASLALFMLLEYNITIHTAYSDLVEKE